MARRKKASEETAADEQPATEPKTAEGAAEATESGSGSEPVVESTVVATKLERMTCPDHESQGHLAKDEGWRVERIEGGFKHNTHHLVREVPIGSDED